ncbi:MAG: hypothetical protein J3R72DRAFT_436457 [Linnemannia gamsii]|nr:MAG: hypothetical protein J3R72DRAFT_436457 [Linnemannia gamsii]
MPIYRLRVTSTEENTGEVLALSTYRPPVIQKFYYGGSTAKVEITTMAHSRSLIDLRFLDPRIELYEMSKMRAYLTDKPYTWATRHEEVLVHPYINRNAIVDHFTYSALWRHSGDWFRFQYNGLRWIDSICSGSPRCYFCMEPGHTDSHCIWLDDKIHSYYSTYCSFCQEHGHDDSECNVDDYCNWCEEYGHDDSNCSEMDDWFASENSIEQYNLVRRFNLYMGSSPST